MKRLLFAFLILFSTLSNAQDDNFTWGQKQNFISCAVISSEYLTGLQLYQKGLPLNVAIKALPKISAEAKERLTGVYKLADRVGILNAYSDINTNFARCSTLVNKLQGRPTFSDSQYGYYFCAGENKLRFEMILRINQNISTNQLFRMFPESHHPVLGHYIDLINESGVLSAFELTADNLKRCLQAIYK